MRSRFLLLGVLIGVIVFVGAVAPVWVGSDIDYVTGEDSVYYHNLSANITGFNNDVTFAIDTDQDINWTNASGNFAVAASIVSGWLNIYNSSTGNLTINATYDNQTGFFIVPIQATNNSDDEFAGTNFEFQVNATNDVPNFTNLNSTYDFPQSGGGFHTISALDEEEHYPLDFNLTFLNNCTHASWSGRADNENCSLFDFGFNLTDISDISTVFNFTPEHNDVGTYWANFSVSDFNGTCPHDYCDVSSYETNQSSEIYVLVFNVYSMLSVDVSNCSGATVMEGETFNCTINVTTRGEADELNFSSYGFFENSITQPNNNTWFYGASSDNASDFFYSLNISITPEKRDVGNWTINFSVWDVLRSNLEMEQIEIFVNWTESNVSLDSIDNITLYENGSFEVNATDEDLLIWDSSVKVEELTFVSNTSWVNVTSPAVVDHSLNYLTSVVSINHSYVMNNGSLGEGNYSVNISVVDNASNMDWKVFVVEVLNESAPVWNVSLGDPVILNLTEDENFIYNVSVNVSDDPGENITFYYEEGLVEFCSLNVSTFNSSGMINFTPTDCDVGIYNVTIIAGNTKLNSSWSFVFNISNVADVPEIFSFLGKNDSDNPSLTEGFNFIVGEGSVVNFSLIIDDDDFLIPGEQEDYYNESMVIDVIFTNSTGGDVSLFNFSFVEFESPSPESVSYNSTFVPGVDDVDDYTVFLNVTDTSGNSINRTWFLNVTEVLDPPVLEQIENMSLTIHDYLGIELNASDDEDDHDGLSYSILRLNEDAPNLTIIAETVSFDMGSNESYAGEWGYNVTVTDNDSMIDWQVFWISVYGFAGLVSPVENSSFNATENVSSVLNFTINHSVGDNLTYEFWIDDVSCSFQNSSNCSYGNLSFRESEVSFGNGSVLGWEFLPNFTEETYGNLKNLTVSVYPNSSLLNSSQRSSVATNFSFKLNISHTNAPMRAVAPIGLLQSDYNSNIEVDLSGYFEDEDVSDSYYLQSVDFMKSSGHADISVSYSSGWDIIIGTIVNSAFTGFISILGNDSLSSDVIEDVEVKFTEPTVVTTPSSGGSGSTTKLKFYSLRIIVPQDVIISDENYIEIPFGLENSGTIDLKGIDLSSGVLYNNAFSDDVKIELEETYIDLLKSGEKKDYVMRILADTDRSGKYKATINANISSPKFSDWADFFIDLRRTNESEAEELLIFTEKIVADNPECLELTEVFRRAEEAFALGDMEEAMRLALEVSNACEDAIRANEQVRYKIEGFVERNFYYISFVTFVMFFVGFIFYVYKRVRFNNYGEDKYVQRGL